jgi:hypothetical protein
LLAAVVAVGAPAVYNLYFARVDSAGLPPMNDPLAPTAPVDASLVEDAKLRTRVVREARRETWFLVNEGDVDLTALPIELRADASLRRVEVNGEASEFSSSGDQVVVTPRRPLRSGAGTIVILHFR